MHGVTDTVSEDIGWSGSESASDNGHTMPSPNQSARVGRTSAQHRLPVDAIAMPEGSPQEALLLRKLNCGKISEAEFVHLLAMTKHQTALDSLDARRGAAITKSASNPKPASRSTPGSTSASALPKWGVHRAAQSSVRTAVQPGQAPEAPPTCTGQTSSQRLGSFFRGLAPKVAALRESVRESGASRVARWRGADAHGRLGSGAVSGDGDGAAEQGDLDSAEQYGVEMGSAWPTIRTPHNHDPSPACTTVDNGAAAGAADLGGTASADPELAAKLKELEDKHGRGLLSRNECDLLVDVTRRASELRMFHPPDDYFEDASSPTTRLPNRRSFRRVSSSFESFRRALSAFVVPHSGDRSALGRLSTDADEHDIEPTSSRDLPDELLTTIFMVLGPAAFVTLGLVCRRWYILSTNEAVWRTCYITELRQRLHKTTYKVGDVLPNITQRGLGWCEAYRRDFSVGLDKLHRRDQARVSVLLVGDRMSGKSAFSKRFCQDSFDPEHSPNLEPSVSSRTVSIDGVGLRFDIWEISHARRHPMRVFQHMRHCDVVICIANPSEPESVRRSHAWIEFVSRYRDNGKLIRVVVGSFADQMATHAVSDVACHAVAAECGATYFACSSATGVGVDAAMCWIGRRMGQVGPEHIRHLFHPPDLSDTAEVDEARDFCLSQ
eukprot:m.393418 g.393418  ORF g.393418 m.393418 type:complete len:666 (+) comp28331_c0_seq15:178-2175(+)